MRVLNLRLLVYLLLELLAQFLLILGCDWRQKLLLALRRVVKLMVVFLESYVHKTVQKLSLIRHLLLLLLHVWVNHTRCVCTLIIVALVYHLERLGCIGILSRVLGALVQEAVVVRIALCIDVLMRGVN